ncbi:uncharacterized protein K452DRAFT_358848 [Aplosporella prunicola CBS 121167]|uniref:Uncharacterized protein n=1 Tax=Aplosporella prunicola CBS 121167 TaxID=1176127 RepID=A0A6A6BBZ0_9PEZI|nr:uncharacterized protein K452DRAFT_358848 [Aplosporella prunicola CBS 121167]KAF2141752.1 hypothetical protein K452DRAFT_358848 [Aplosporella prunicola CBS 121167]
MLTAMAAILRKADAGAGSAQEEGGTADTGGQTVTSITVASCYHRHGMPVYPPDGFSSLTLPYQPGTQAQQAIPDAQVPKHGQAGGAALPPAALLLAHLTLVSFCLYPSQPLILRAQADEPGRGRARGGETWWLNRGGCVDGLPRSCSNVAQTGMGGLE